jgi:glycosyltransferase involved in cell wall biosynthesis
MNKILTITPSLYGGAGNFITSWVSYLQKNGYSNTLITSGDPGQYKDWEIYIGKLGSLGVKIQSLNFFHRDSSIFWKSCEELVDIIKAGDFSLIHTHSAVPTLAARIALDITGKKIPLIATFYSFGVGRPHWMDFADFYSFGKADKVIVISSYCHDLLIKNGVLKSKVILIPIGIDIDAIEYNKGNRKKMRDTLGINDDEILLVQLAAIEKRKNQMMSVKILEELKGKSDKKFKLLLVGDKKEDNYYLEIAEYIKKMHLDEDVFFTSKVDNPHEYLFASDIFIFPTLSEGQGLAIIEAMAAKIPVFTTSIEGTTDIIRDNENGFVISPDEPEIAVDKISRLIEDDKIKEALITNAYSLVRENFGISKTYEENMEIYSGFFHSKIKL